MTVNQIKKFERANDISIYVYYLEEKNIVPIRLSELKRDKHVNLLYVQDSRDDNVGHFAWIKNLFRLTFRSTTHCHICEKPFYRGPAHSNCNLNYKNSFYIPIVFHNLSGYDSHFIIKEIATAFEGSIDVLSITKENIYLLQKMLNLRKRNQKIISNYIL
ncbi:hypothetical protein ACFW04_014017 [Cataglyphis niger]